MTERPPIRTQILVFTLFGEYIPRGGKAWTKTILSLLELLEVSERAGRSTLSRMRKNGWLVARRNGRYSKYALTKRGMRVVTEGEARIFEPRRTDWNGMWHMVVYSIPEGKRRIRADLRRRLGWMGFGRLAPGTWISPNNPQSDIQDMLEDIGAADHAICFSDMKLKFSSEGEIVQRCWNLAELNKDYSAFIEKYEPVYHSFQKAYKRGKPFPPSECFRLRFWITLEYAQFPRRDPNLPNALLEPDWLGTRATELFFEFHEVLKQPSERYVREVLNNPFHIN
jgi:phenylacetic acid degradation operon negative regulatory protein